MKPQPLAVRLRRLRQEAICLRRQMSRVVDRIAALQKDIEQQGKAAKAAKVSEEL